MKFLMGLDPEYTIVRGQILMMDPLPNINKVFSLVLQEERQKGVPIVSSSSTMESIAL